MNKHLSIDDFCSCCNIDELKSHSPSIKITVTLTHPKSESPYGDELVTVSNWLVSIDENFEAQLQYEYFLPDEYEKQYQKEVSDKTDISDIKNILSGHFIRLYVNRLWGGFPELHNIAESSSLSRFDFQFLDAIRDVERDMFSGRNALLKNVIDFFIDYDIKSKENLSKEDKEAALAIRHDEFVKSSDPIIASIQERLAAGNEQILSYSNEIGASFNDSHTEFTGKLTENEIYSILQLVIKQKTGMDIPIANNGLGYNNLIFMALLLSKMQIDSDGSYMGSNAKVFPILAIEEPEAHLHPSMQFQFINFLKNNLKKNKVKQVFITTHSTHITASADLDEVICLYPDSTYCTCVSYPGQTFPTEIIKDKKTGEEREKVSPSKKYVQRFLDATKSNMLFADGIILVEGIAEQLLIPVLATYLDISLEKHHISVINIGGRYFDHFLHLFDIEKNGINKKIACITDRDPVRKLNDKENDKYKACYPYEYKIDTSYSYDYNSSLKNHENDNMPNIRWFSQPEEYGKTLEYEIALTNPNCPLLLTESLSNQNEIKDLMKLYSEGKPIEELVDHLTKSEENIRIKNSILQASKLSKWDSLPEHLIASRYLNSVSKGVTALELSSDLKENIQSTEPTTFTVPEYIKDAITWVIQK